MRKREREKEIDKICTIEDRNKKGIGCLKKCFYYLTIHSKKLCLCNSCDILTFFNIALYLLLLYR